MRTCSCPVSRANDAESFTDAVVSPTASYATQRNVSLLVTKRNEASWFPGMAPRSTDVAPAHSPGVIAPSTVGGADAHVASITSPEWAPEVPRAASNPAATVTTATKTHRHRSPEPRVRWASPADPPCAAAHGGPRYFKVR